MTKKKEWSNDIRELIISHRQEGKSIREIVRMVKVPRSTVYDIIMKHQRTGSVNNHPRSGRKRATSTRVDRTIERRVLKNRRLSAKRLVKQIKNDFGVTICPQTVRNRLNEVGLHGRVARKKLLIRKQNQVKRLIWAKERKSYPSSYWDQVLWADEKKFSLFSSKGRQWIWRRSRETWSNNCIDPVVQYNPSIMI